MDNWKFDLGTVAHWDEDENNFRICDANISYQASLKLPLEINYYYEIPDGYGRFKMNSNELTIENKDDGSINLSGDIFILSEEQKGKIFSVLGKWQYTPLNAPEPDVNDRIPDEHAKDFGIVYFYDFGDEQFTTANLKIGFDWKSTRPIIMFIQTYDDDRFPEKKINSQHVSLTANYEGQISGLEHYTICDNHFLLASRQVEFLMSIINQLSK